MRIPFGDSKGGGLYKLKSGRGYILVAFTKSVNTLVFSVDDARWGKNGEIILESLRCHDFDTP